MDAAHMTVDQLKTFAQAEKAKGDRSRANLAKARKSAEQLTKAAAAVAEISKKNPEL